LCSLKPRRILLRAVRVSRWVAVYLGAVSWHAISILKNWSIMSSLLDVINYNGVRAFEREELNSRTNLFDDRAALYYTPTCNIPKYWVGEGDLDISVPLAIPKVDQMNEMRPLYSPRIWVDLLQRATGKIRWREIISAEIKIIRYDIESPKVYDLGGAKGLIDALKQNTYGRTDGRLIYYFGAIINDDAESITIAPLEYEEVGHPNDAKTRIIVYNK